MVRKLKESFQDGSVAIWWYTDDGEFWAYCKSLDDADTDYNFLQYSNTKNHLTLWRDAVNTHVLDKDEAKNIIAKGYKSIERGRIVYNLRTQSYEVTCSDKLAGDSKFRERCIDYFNLRGCRYSFVPLTHYGKQELTGNLALDSMYYEL